jgi:hypothetical protein
MIRNAAFTAATLLRMGFVHGTQLASRIVVAGPSS